jgi:lipopolysaccharide transport system ATP-binding protein
MSNTALGMEHVSKKFKKGEVYDSLRDLVPALSKRLLGRGTTSPLSKNEFWALRDVSFSIEKGEAFGIIGSNGAGKSTILKLLSGIMKPTEGVINVKGMLSGLIEVGAGFHPDLTGRDNVFLNGTILGMKKEQIKKKFDAIVEFSGLGDFIDTPVKRYSSGMYARLGFAVAAHVDPDILLVDEVLSVGDYAFQNKCLDKMKSIQKDGVTIIFVSHNLKAVTEMCDRCLLLDHGQIAQEGTAHDVVDAYLNPKVDEGTYAAKDLYITKAVFRNREGQALQFNSGEKVYLETEISCKAGFEKLSVSMIILDENNNRIFDTSTERLTHRSFSLKAGERLQIRFDLDLHLAPGKYHIGTYIYRYDIEELYDSLLPAATIHVRSDLDFKGVVNLYPKATFGTPTGRVTVGTGTGL